jgi:hypothetical protein
MVAIGVRSTYVPASWAVYPVGIRVWLPREGRHGRVIVQAQGGLLYRVRLEGGTAPQLLDCSACELRPASEGGAG